MALETKVDIILDSQKTMTTKLDMMIPTLVTQPQLTEKISALKEHIVSLELDLQKAKNRSSVFNVLTGIFSAAFGVLMTVLIQSYLSKG